MVVGLPDGLFEFQEKAVNYLLEITSRVNSKQTIIVKAPTGAGKTVILIDFIDEYLNSVNSNTAFIWLCPGKGDLEEQSKKKMLNLCPSRNTKNLFDALLTGFEAGSTTFINWELVTKKGNTAIKDSERKNLYDAIADSHRKGVEFIVIIDEEHSNNTSKARDIIDSFSAKHIIRVSATTEKNDRYEYYEIDETEVIDEGLITSAISVNEGIEENTAMDDDLLLDYADRKRQEIARAYKDLDKDIRPLVLIQFPSGQPERIEAVEKKLESMGYTYGNGMVSKWMSEDKKDLPDNLTENNASPVFLLMKQAISVGWDCPRAKILVKLREGGNETFQVQTIGRIRRMPEAMHYEVTELDLCYVYTFDEQYKAGLLAGVDKAYIPRRLFAKEKCRTFTLEKQLRDLDFDGMSEREMFTKVKKYFVNKYNLTEDKKNNQQMLEELGDYRFGDQLYGKALQGRFVLSASLVKENVNHYITTKSVVDTHRHGIYLIHSIDELKTILGIKAQKVKAILERLFRNFGNKKHKLLALDTKEFYAFVINNCEQLKHDFRNIAGEISSEQLRMHIDIKTAIFHIPEQDFFKYDPTVKKEVDYLTNAYKEYTSGYATTVVRSISEMLFEKYCEQQRDTIDWVYKNGDTGQQYMSIVYWTGIDKQRLFYPDYIVKKADGTVWLIETKGGMSKGQDKNIDKQIENKFIALRDYATAKNLKWGFVRDLDGDLYINNTEFHQDLADEHWIPLESEF